jgi:hypothetical protein
MWGPGKKMWHEYQYFVVKAMVSCIAILADQGLRLRANINDGKGPSSDVLTV